MELYREHAHTVIPKLETQEITAEELVHSVFDRIEKVEDRVNAFIVTYKDEALNEAKAIDKLRRDKKKVGKMAGVPLGVKALISVKGQTCSCGSLMLKDYVAPYDAFIIKKLVREAQAIIIGRTNMDEFAMGSSTESSYFGITKNPWDLERVPGGSSGGSSAAMAADESIVALGSDTGGSIRCPSSFTGTTGIKTTYGRNSRYGIAAYSDSLEQVGPMTKSVKDTALMLEIMAGYDPQDSTSVDTPVDTYTEGIDEGIEGIEIGIPKEFFGEGIDEIVTKKVREGIKTLESLGAQTKEISLPHLKYALPTYYVIAMSEASSNLARFDGLRYGYRTKNQEEVERVKSKFRQRGIPISGTAAEFMITRKEAFGAEVRRRIILGTFALSAGYADQYYIQALKVRSLIKNDFLNALKECDVLVGPTMPHTAFKIGVNAEDPIQMYMEDILTVPINLAAVPSISVNCGFDNNTMPIGMQIIGNYFKEKTILKVGNAYEEKTQLYKKRAPL